MLKRINMLLEDIGRNGNEGLGKPEALKHDFAGYWSRRITDEHRLVHKVVGDEVRIAACRYHYGCESATVTTLQVHPPPERAEPSLH